MVGFKLATAIGAGAAPKRDWAAGSVLAADFAAQDFRLGTKRFNSKTAWLAAAGGTALGETLVLGPKVMGAELLADGGFSAGLDGWAASPSFAANGAIEMQGEALKLVHSGAGTAFRASRPVATDVGRAYRFAGTVVSQTGLSAIALAAQGNSDLFSGNVSVQLGTAINVLPQRREVPFAATGAVTTIGFILGGPAGTPGHGLVDDLSVMPVHPHAGFDPAGFSATVWAQAPATAVGNKVLAQWDSGLSERDRVRLVWDADAHLRLIVTFGNAQQANLDLGTVAPSSSFKVGLSAQYNGFAVNLDGGAPVVANMGAMPGLAVFRLGRSQTGEAWDGTITRFLVRGQASGAVGLVDPLRGLAVYGDSTARGDGATVPWASLVAAGHSPPMALHNAGAGGETLAQMAARLIADTSHRGWTAILMDRINGDETAQGWLATMAQAIGTLRTARILIYPQIPRADGSEASGAVRDKIDAINAGIRERWPNNTLPDWTDLIAALSDPDTRTDGLHRNNAGQALEAAAISAFLAGKGW